MSQLEYIQGVMKELRAPKPGQQQYYLVINAGGRDSGFYVWPDADFLKTVQLQIGQPYNVGFEQRGKYRTAREVSPIAQGAPVMAQPAPMPVQVAQVAPQIQQPLYTAPAAPQRASMTMDDVPIVVQAMAKSLLEGGHTNDVLHALSLAERGVKDFLGGARFYQAAQSVAGPLGDDPPPYEDYPR